MYVGYVKVQQPAQEDSHILLGMYHTYLQTDSEMGITPRKYFSKYGSSVMRSHFYSCLCHKDGTESRLETNSAK